MKALILVGGEGTRLRPLTYERPKPMLPIAAVPFVERTLRRLHDVGCEEVVLSACYRSEAFDRLTEHTAPRVRIVVEEEPLGTGGAIRYATEAVGGFDGTFFVLNGDVLTDVDLAMVLERHRGTGAEATIVLTPVEDPSRFGVVPTDPAGRVIRFIEKPPRDEAPTNMINAGTYVCEQAMLEGIPAGVCSVERYVFPRMAESGVLYGCPGESYWLDFGTLPTYLQANIDCLEGRLHEPLPGIRRSVGGGHVWMDETAQLAADVDVVGNVVMSSGSVVESGARIGPSVVLGPKSHIGTGAVVSETVLLDAAVVERDARVHRAIVGDRGCVCAGRRLPADSVVPPDQSI